MNVQSRWEGREDERHGGIAHFSCKGLTIAVPLSNVCYFHSLCSLFEQSEKEIIREVSTKIQRCALLGVEQATMMYDEADNGSRSTWEGSAIL